MPPENGGRRRVDNELQGPPGQRDAVRDIPAFDGELASLPCGERCDKRLYRAAQVGPAEELDAGPRESGAGPEENEDRYELARHRITV